MIGGSVIDGKAKGQIEVAVVEGAVPSYAELVATHQSLHRHWIEGLPEQVQVIPFLAKTIQFRSKPPERHVGDGEKTGKRDAETFAQLTSVVFFKG